MENEICELPAETAEVLELGVVLGHGKAFGLVAGRCSAAQAQSLRQLREEKKYLRLSPIWRDFCPKYVGMSGSHADRIIALLDEFGPGYFELAQLTRISSDTYRAVEPVVKDHALHYHGEVITLDPGNARRVAEAVANLRREAAVKPPPVEKGMEGLILDIDKRFQQIVADIEHMAHQSGNNWKLFSEVIDRMGSTLARLIRENKL